MASASKKNGADASEQADGGSSKTGLVVDTTAGAATLFLLLRVLAVSEWNWNTAAIVAESFNFSDILPVAPGTMFARPMLTGAIIAMILQEPHRGSLI